MDWTFLFFFNSILLGVGLAMDAFSVSAANALNEPDMKAGKMWGMAITFGVFQIVMPLVGWVLVQTVASVFEAFLDWVPWIALILLAWIGGKMLWDGIRMKDGGEPAPAVGFWGLMVQGVATSIDALSVGFSMTDQGLTFETWQGAAVEMLIIGVTTTAICVGGVFIGKKFGTKLSGKASILGGCILIGIGLEIFIKGLIA